MATAESRGGLLERLYGRIFEEVTLLTPKLYREKSELRTLLRRVREGEIRNPDQIEAINKRGFEWQQKVYARRFQRRR